MGKLLTDKDGTIPLAPLLAKSLPVFDQFGELHIRSIHGTTVTAEYLCPDGKGGKTSVKATRDLSKGPLTIGRLNGNSIVVPSIFDLSDGELKTSWVNSSLSRTAIRVPPRWRRPQ